MTMSLNNGKNNYGNNNYEKNNYEKIPSRCNNSIEASSVSAVADKPSNY